jgi:hypothetical protein
MKFIHKPTKKRVTFAIVAGLIVGLLTFTYMRVVAYESAQPDPGADAAALVAAQALGDSATPSQSTQVDSTAPAPAQASGSSSIGVTQKNSPQPTAASSTPSNGRPPDDPRALWALQNAGAADPDGGAVNLNTFPYATNSGAKSRDGYPIYLIECNAGSHQCVGESGQPIGSAMQVANTITPVRNADALRYSCPDWICVDPQGNVVGSVAPAMRPYVTQTHQAAP